MKIEDSYQTKYQDLKISGFVSLKLIFPSLILTLTVIIVKDNKLEVTKIMWSITV
jgi:hypothetical protein